MVLNCALFFQRGVLTIVQGFWDSLVLLLVAWVTRYALDRAVRLMRKMGVGQMTVVVLVDIGIGLL